MGEIHKKRTQTVFLIGGPEFILPLFLYLGEQQLVRIHDASLPFILYHLSVKAMALCSLEVFILFCYYCIYEVPRKEIGKM